MTETFCQFCTRPEFTKTPTVDEHGQSLPPSEIHSIYNERRYQHYLDGFNDRLDLGRHLIQRAKHWVATSPDDSKQEVLLAQLKLTEVATLAWWEVARRRNPEAAEQVARFECEPTSAETVEWTRLTPAQRFAKLKTQIARTLKAGAFDLPPDVSNAQELPEERELTDEQITALEAERNRQAEALAESMEEDQP